MQYILLILNRVYWFLTSVNNSSPFLGAVILVTLLIGIFIRNLLLFFYYFKPEPMITNKVIDFLILGVIFIFIYFFSKKNRDIIKTAQVNSLKLQNWIVAILFISTVSAFILLANVNREKIFNNKNLGVINKSQKESLENKIKNWFK